MGIRKLYIVFSFFIVNSISVFGSGRYLLPSSIEKIFLFLFKTLPEGMRSESALAVVYFKLLLWIFVFAVIYSSLKKVFHDNNRVAAAIAFVVSLSSVMLISSTIVVKIFKMYSAIISVVLVLLPLLILFYLGKTIFPKAEVKSGWAKGLMFIAAAMVILFLSVSIFESGNTQMFAELARWMEIAAVICFFMGLISFFEGAGGIVKGDYSKQSKPKSSDDSGGSKSVSKADKNKALQQKENELTKYLKKADYYEFVKIEQTIIELNNIANILSSQAFNKKKLLKRMKIARNLWKKERSVENLIGKVMKKMEKIEKIKEGLDSEKQKKYDKIRDEKIKVEETKALEIKQKESNFKRLIDQIILDIERHAWGDAANGVNAAIQIKQEQAVLIREIQNILQQI